MTALVNVSKAATDEKLLNDVKTLYCQSNTEEWFYIQERLNEMCHFNVGLFENKVINLLE
jgi:hypothetical protein